MTTTRIKIEAREMVMIRALARDIELRIDSAGCDIAEEIALSSDPDNYPTGIDSEDSAEWDAFFELSSECLSVVIDMVCDNLKRNLC